MNENLVFETVEEGAIINDNSDCCDCGCDADYGCDCDDDSDCEGCNGC